MKTSTTNEIGLTGHHNTKKWVGLGLIGLLCLLIFFMFKPSSSKADKSGNPGFGVQRAVYQPKNPPKAPRDKKESLKSIPEPVQHQEQQNFIEMERAKVLMERRQAPMVVYQAAGQTSHQAISQQTESSPSQLLQVNAHQIEHLDYTIIQGKLIPAILESAINSDLPGLIRAVVKENVYAEKGERVLIPKGARLIGNYESDLDVGQSRIFVVWQRLIRPDGIEVQLDSPGINALGQAGLSGEVNTHFWARFGEAVLLSLISAGASNINVSKGDEFNSQAAYRQAASESFASSASNSLNRTQGLGPTVHINQGTPIKVFVAKDLNFYGVLKERA